MSDATAAAAPAPGLRGRATSHRAFVTVCTMLATLMQTLDNTIANVALPYMQGPLNASSSQITWVLTSYIIAAAIMTAPVGWLAARFGLKNLFLFCIVGFTLASMLCGLAESLPQIVLFRVAQGVFGAALIPLSQTTMMDLYPLEERGPAMAIWSMGVMLGPILGPTVGGLLTEYYSWRWVFYINVPIGIAAFTGLFLFLKDHPLDRSLRFDWMGFAFLALALGGFQLMLDRGEQLDWFGSTEIVLEAVVAGLCLYLFVVHMATAERPFIPPRIFRDRNFFAGLVVMFMMGIVLLSSSALLPPYLQTLGGYSVEETGLLMAPRGIGTMIAMMLAGQLARRVDARLLILIGILLMAASAWDMSSWTPSVSGTRLTMTTMLQGFGMGFVFVPLQVAAFTTLAPEHRTDGAALFSLMRNIGSAIGVSLFVYMLGQSMAASHAGLVEELTPFNRMLQQDAQGLFWNPMLPFGRAMLDAEVQRQAAIIAYANDFLLMLWIGLPTALVLLLMKKPAIYVAPESGAAAAME